VVDGLDAAAADAGSVVVGVLTGAHTVQELGDAGPTQVLESVAGLPDLLAPGPGPGSGLERVPWILKGGCGRPGGCSIVMT
jgi:hypothetical protein